MTEPTWDDMLKAMDAMKREGILHEMNEPAPYTIRDLIDKERELARGAGAASDEYFEKWAEFMKKALGFATTSEELRKLRTEQAAPTTWATVLADIEHSQQELKRLAETPAQKEARRRSYEGHEQQLATTEPNMNDDAMDAAKYNTASGKKFSLSEDDYRDILPEFVKLHQRLRSSRPTFMDRVISDLERGDDEADWSNFTIKSMYGKELQ